MLRNSDEHRAERMPPRQRPSNSFAENPRLSGWRPRNKLSGCEPNRVQHSLKAFPA